MKHILTAVLLAASLMFAAPVLSQDKAPTYTIHLVDVAPKTDTLAQSLYQAMEASLKSHVSDGVAIVETEAEQSDASAPEINFLSVASDDKKSSVIIVVVAYHVQGQSYEKYIGTVAGSIDATLKVDEVANGLLHDIGGAVSQYEHDQESVPTDHAQQN